MTTLAYNLALAVGLALAFAGAWLQLGPGPALLLLGCLVIALTLFGALLTRRR